MLSLERETKASLETEGPKKQASHERLIIFTVPPPATLRDQDATDSEMFQAGLKWREAAGLTGPDEFGPLSGDRWHLVLERLLSEASVRNRKSHAAELEFLVKILERTATRRPDTDRLWADILRRFIRDDYGVPNGRPKQAVRDQLLLRHYWLIRRIFPRLSEDDCTDAVSKAYAETGGSLSPARIKRIAKAAQKKREALLWIDEQLKFFSKHAPDVVERALLATFEPLASDRKLLTGLCRPEVK
jgi:hypothetical protein